MTTDAVMLLAAGLLLGMASSMVWRGIFGAAPVQRVDADGRLLTLILRAHHVSHYGFAVGCGHAYTCEQCGHNRQQFVKRWRLLSDALGAYSKTGEYDEAMARYRESDEYRQKFTTHRNEQGDILCRECQGPMVTYEDLKPDDAITTVDMVGTDQDTTGMEYRFCRPCKSRQIVKLGQ